MTLPTCPADQALHDLITYTCTTYPLFNATVSTGHGCKGEMYWVLNTALEPEKHIIKVELDSGDWKKGTEEVDSSNRNSLDVALRGYVSSHINDGFDLQRGMFQLHVVTYSGKVNRCDLVWRIHHGIGDGVLLSRVLESLCVSMDAGKEPAQRPSTKRKKKKISPLTLFGRAIVSTVTTLGLPLSFSDKKTILKAPSNTSKMGQVKCYGSSSVWKVADAKLAGSYYSGATVNDVITATLSEALRNYNLEKNCSVTERGGKGLNVRALAVVNTRAFGGTDTVLEDFKKCKAANEFSYVVPRLPLGPMSVGERVAKCKKEFDYLKSSPQAFVIKKLNNVLRGCFGGGAVVWLNTKHVINKFTCFFSNLAGPRGKLSVAGVEILRLSNFVHPMDYTLGVSIQSYNGDVVINFSADKGVVEDVERIGVLADEAFRKIVEEAKTGGEGGDNTV